MAEEEVEGVLEVRFKVELIRRVKGKVRKVTYRERGPYRLLTESSGACMAMEDTINEFSRMYGEKASLRTPLYGGDHTQQELPLPKLEGETTHAEED